MKASVERIVVHCSSNIQYIEAPMNTGSFDNIKGAILCCKVNIDVLHMTAMKVPHSN